MIVLILDYVDIKKNKTARDKKEYLNGKNVNSSGRCNNHKCTHLMTKCKIYEAKFNRIKGRIQLIELDKISVKTR